MTIICRSSFVPIQLSNLPKAIRNSRQTLSEETSHAASSQPRSKPKSLKLFCHICPYHSQKTFARKADLDRHIFTKHCPPPDRMLSQCPWPNCDRKGANGFLRRDKMLQHQDKVH